MSDGRTDGNCDGLSYNVLTYATHAERYFETLLKSCPEIVVYGFGQPWKGFHDKVAAVVEHCKSVGPDSVVCFVDGFDSVCVGTRARDALAGFKAFRRQNPTCRILFSREVAHPLAGTYVMDKLFGKCRDVRLNSGMYMGFARDVAAFWADMKPGDDDQTYATGRCNADRAVGVDVDCRVFYNFDERDGHRVDGRLIVTLSGSQTTSSPCFVSAPGAGDMNDLLALVGFPRDSLPVMRGAEPSGYLLRTLKHFFFSFVPEILTGAAIAVTLVCLRRRMLLAVMLSVFMYSEVVHYQAYAKHAAGGKTKAGPLAVHMLFDALHMGVVLLVYYLLFGNMVCDTRKLLLLNVIYLGIVLQFFILRRCSLTMASNWAIGENQDALWTGPAARVSYMFGGGDYIKRSEDPASQWIRGNVTPVTLLACLNAYCLCFGRLCSRRV